jgi:hypothetical protein
MLSEEAVFASQVVYELIQLVMSLQVASEPVGTIVANMDNKRASTIAEAQS